MEYPDALTLLAAIVMQARKDLASHPLDKCLIPYSHAARYCGISFLTAINTKVNHSPRRMTIEEMAFAVLEIIE
jgi:hypothetical protein